VIGAGLIGASIGLRARECGMRVAGYDAVPENGRKALEAGALDLLAEDLRSVGEAEVLVLATPLDATLALLERLVREPPRAALVLDVASLKEPVARAGAALANFVPTHPIAGSERSGPEAARADLFAGKVWTYDPAASAEALERLAAFVTAMGALAVPVASDEHDRIVALTSDLPQVVAVALGALLRERIDGEPAVAALCGTGIRGAIRLGASPWTMWRPILTSNAAPAAREVRRLCALLSEVAGALEAGRPQELEPHFAAAAAAFAQLDGDGGNVEAARHVPSRDLPAASR